MSDLNAMKGRANHFFVDEAGDPNLFNRRKNVIVGQNGCSQYFALGCLEVHEPALLEREMSGLRRALLADPLLNVIPSMQPVAGKTARAFHAKDDVAEVRHEVFKLLRRHELVFRAVFLYKAVLVQAVKGLNEQDPLFRHSANRIYDQLVHHLFIRPLQRAGDHHVTFATRGNSDRTGALRTALSEAQEWLGRPSAGGIHVVATTPPHAVGLQAVDYFLWALQRSLERGEHRFINALRPQIAEIWDFDNPERVWEAPGV